MAVLVVSDSLRFIQVLAFPEASTVSSLTPRRELASPCSSAEPREGSIWILEHARGYVACSILILTNRLSFPRPILSFFPKAIPPLDLFIRQRSNERLDPRIATLPADSFRYLTSDPTNQTIVLYSSLSTHARTGR